MKFFLFIIFTSFAFAASAETDEEVLQNNLKKPMSGECRYQYDRLIMFQKLKDKALMIVQRSADMLEQGKTKGESGKQNVQTTHTNTKLKLEKINNDMTKLKEKMVMLGCPGVTI
jgi:hypothetical protein